MVLCATFDLVDFKNFGRFENNNYPPKNTPPLGRGILTEKKMPRGVSFGGLQHPQVSKMHDHGTSPKLP